MNAPLPTPLDYPWTRPPAPGESIEVVSGLHWIRMPLPFALDHINLWLARDPDGRWTVIDTGYRDEATSTLWERHFSSTMRGASLARVIATHYHPDHLGNAAWLARRFAAPVRMTQAEFLTAHAIIDQRATHTLEETCAFFVTHGVAPKDVETLHERGNAYSRGVPEAPRTIERLIDGDVVAAGAHAWTVMTGYGHSPEHISLHSADAGALVSGDMLLPRISTNVSVWPANPEDDPVGRFLASIGDFESLPEDTLVLPSHGLPFRGIAARVAELRAHHAARLAELVAALERLARAASAAEIVPVLFRRELDLQQRFFAVGESIAHLNHLTRAGRIERRVGADGAIRFRA